MKHILRTLLLLSLLVCSIGCVTKKKKDDVSKLGLFYHNTTAKFNGYFNANVLLTESIAKLNEQHQDNYSKILDMYPYIAVDNPQSVAEQLDEATKKVSIVVSLHRPSHWTDDCYLVIGKAQFLKQNYEDAEETLEYFREEFSPETLKAKKENRKKGKKGKKKSSSKRKKGSKASSKNSSSKSAKQRAKERKKYNKQVRKNKKKKKKSKSSSSRKKKEDTKVVEAPVAPPPKVEKKETKPEKSSKSEESDNYFLKHKPAFQEGMLWLAKTYIERESYPEAESILNALDRDPDTFEEIKAQLTATRAYMFIKQRQFETALPYLEQAAEKTDDKHERARFTYIIAQIHQQAGRGDTAYQYFEKALKYSTTYEMEFSAKLNLARNGWVVGSASSAQTIKALNKMLKDIKNEEYRDQIYFALAEIAMKDNDRVAAKHNLKKSLSSSIGNSPQRTESYLQLAELYFEDQEYVNAKAYYDSTMQVMAETDERYELVKRFNDNLTDIAKNITIIEEQDSLLRISNMSEKDKQALAYDMMKKEEEARRKALLEGNKEGKNFNVKNNRTRIDSRNTRNRTEPSTFFAYDDKRVKKGKKDFEKRWGKRKLEDNWRRSNKRGTNEIDDTQVEEERIALEVTEEDVKKLLKNVPTTDKEVAAAHKKIEGAYFNLGRLYRDRLENNEKAVEALEELLRRYPDTEHQLEAWYYLHIAYNDLNNRAKAKEYYDKIVSNHPNTTYARVLQDPNFLQANKEEERRLIAYYDETYNAFQQGEYDKAVERAKKADELFGNKNTMQAKFALLSALSIGNIKGKDAYVAALKDLIAKYPDTAESTRAKEILRLLTGGNVSAGTGDDDAPANTGNFKLQNNKVHYFIVVLDGKTVKLEDAKIAVSNYNRTYHNLDKLRISNIYLGANTNTPILVIRRFKNKDVAMKYFDGIEQNKADFLPDGTQYEYFPVTQHNYREILKSKTLDGYRTYFQDNYFNN